MKLIYMLSYKDKEASRWFPVMCFASESAARQAKDKAEQEDGDDFIYKVTQIPFEE